MNEINTTSEERVVSAAWQPNNRFVTEEDTYEDITEFLSVVKANTLAELKLLYEEIDGRQYTDPNSDGYTAYRGQFNTDTRGNETFVLGGSRKKEKEFRAEANSALCYRKGKVYLTQRSGPLNQHRVRLVPTNFSLGIFEGKAKVPNNLLVVFENVRVNISKLEALAALRRRPNDFNLLLALTDPTKIEETPWCKSYERGNLDDTQDEAARSLKKAIEVINGPPGTGKTSTILQILSNLLTLPVFHHDNPKSVVLVSAIQNEAVANICQKLEAQGNVGFILYGNPDNKNLPKEAHQYFLKEQVMKRRQDEIAKLQKQHLQAQNERLPKKDAEDKLNNEDPQFNASATESILNECRVLVSTVGSMHSLSRQRDFSDWNFDALILDEAGVANSSHALLAIERFNPTKVLLVGDQWQLQGFTRFCACPKFSRCRNRDCTKNHEIPKANKSLLKKVVDATGRYHMLKVCYRMTQNLLRVVNRFYDGDLQSPPEKEEGIKPTACIYNDRCDSTRWLTKDRNNSKEAEYTRKLFRKAPEHVKSNDVFIVAPYKNQVATLKKVFKRELRRYPTLKICTVDGVQGQEVGTVYLSMTLSALHERDRFGTTVHSPFVQDMHRLCVALSRAKYNLVVVCSESLRCHINEGKAVSKPKSLRSLLGLGKDDRNDWLFNRVRDVKEGVIQYFCPPHAPPSASPTNGQGGPNIGPSDGEDPDARSSADNSGSGALPSTPPSAPSPDNSGTGEANGLGDALEMLQFKDLLRITARQGSTAIEQPA
jgi:hypothetical protein